MIRLRATVTGRTMQGAAVATYRGEKRMCLIDVRPRDGHDQTGFCSSFLICRLVSKLSLMRQASGPTRLP